MFVSHSGVWPGVNCGWICPFSHTQTKTRSKQIRQDQDQENNLKTETNTVKKLSRDETVSKRDSISRLPTTAFGRCPRSLLDNSAVVHQNLKLSKLRELGDHEILTIYVILRWNQAPNKHRTKQQDFKFQPLNYSPTNQRPVLKHYNVITRMHISIFPAF